MEEESWGLSVEQHSAAEQLTSDTISLLLRAAASGLEVGQIGGELARLSRLGFVEFGSSGQRRAAIVTRAGLATLLLVKSLRVGFNA